MKKEVKEPGKRDYYSVLQLNEIIIELRWESLPLGGIHMEDLQ
jgi:hypothetical protein